MINKSIPKLDSERIVTGQPIYTDDFPLPPGALTLKLLRCPYAHARILEINCEIAKKVPGVVAVYTYLDVPQRRYTRSGKSYPESSPYDHLLLDQTLRYVGDEVAIVAAETEAAAQKALPLIRVKYEVLTPLLDPCAAEDNPIRVHPEPGMIAPSMPPHFEPERNVISQFDVEVGDIEKELCEAQVHVDSVYSTQAQAHCMMETYRAASYYDENGRIVVISSTQVPYHARRQIAYSLGLSVGQVRVIKPRIGGGFGGKSMVVVEPFVAFVTMMTKRPARLIYTRRETFEASSTRHAMVMRVELGADPDGTLRALRLNNINNTGAYGEDGPAVTMVAANNILPTYNRASAIRYQGKTVYTNMVPGSALRGYGATQSAFAIESAMNELADRLGMDPVELRRINMARLGDRGGVLHSEIRSCALEECIRRGKEMIGWDGKYPSYRIGETRVRGLGMAITTHRTSIPNVDKADVCLRLEDDGTFLLLSGSADLGTGSDTVLAQIAAEALQVSLSRIVVRSGDTDSCPYDSGAYASCTTYVTGNAVLKACKSMRGIIMEAAAKMLGLDVQQLIYGGERIVAAFSPDRQVTLRQIATRSHLGATELIFASESYGSQLAPIPYAASFAEVEVDLETGCVNLEDLVMVVDCGTVINPSLARVQAEGGVSMAVGLALYEDVLYDSRGRLLTNSFMQYKLPCRKDLNNRVRVEFAESYEPSGPYGAKSVGEIVVHATAPAIAHAVYNATGVRIRNLPITPEKIWSGLNKSGANR